MIHFNSNINTQTKTPSFKGWDASKPLEKIYLGLPTFNFDRFYPVMEELAPIEAKENIKLIYVRESGIINNASKKIIQNTQDFLQKTKNLLKKEPHLIGFYVWLQDAFTQVPNKKILFQDIFDHTNDKNTGLFLLSEKIAKETNHKIFNPNEIYYDNMDTLDLLNERIAGGNIFQGLNKNKMPYVLLGSNCANELNKQQLLEIFDTNNVHYVPSADFHLDLFIRPLDKGKILVADDNLSLQFLEDIKKDLKQNQNITKEKLIKFNEFIKETKNSIKQNKQSKQYANTDEVCNFLKSKNFDVIKIPGRFFETKKHTTNAVNLSQNANFINAFVQKRNNGTFGYITNRANPKYTGEININPYFEKYLKKTCPEITDVYFISGNNYIAQELKDFFGGVHCRGAEFI